MRSQTNSLRSADLELDLRQRHDHPAKAFAAAVLDGARDDLTRGRRVAGEAREWFEESAPTRACSFEWCCEILGLDPDAVRQQIGGGRNSEALPLLRR